MVEIIWTDNAIGDLLEIGEFIGKDSPKYAELTVSTLFYLPSVLIHHPKAGKVVPEFAKPDIRELISGNYRLIYRIVNYERIDVLTVHYCSRLIGNTIKQEDNPE